MRAYAPPQYRDISYRQYPSTNGWFKKEIRSIADLKRLKMRIPGFAGEVVSKVGMKPLSTPPGELYTSLERGTIDTVGLGPANDEKLC